MKKRLEGFHCWAMSHRGLVRSNNEDSFAVSPLPGASALWEGLIYADPGWVLIADGMGGHAGGEVASHLAVECLRDMSDLLCDEEGVEQALAVLHDTMFAAMVENKSLVGMGTTIAGVFLGSKHALCFNVGDSRIYHMGTTLTLVSEDHVIDGHILTRCIGGSNRDVPEPFITRVLWKQGQRLLLCTDGLTDMLDDDEIAAILDSGQSEPADALVAAALEAGGRDNVTVIVLEHLD